MHRHLDLRLLRRNLPSAEDPTPEQSHMMSRELIMMSRYSSSPNGARIRVDREV